MEHHNERINKIIYWTTNFYVWIAGAILIFWLTLKITGHSPQPVEILLGLNTAIITCLLGGGLYIGKKLGKLERLTIQFDSLAKDFKSEMKNTTRFEITLNKMETKLDFLSENLASLSADLKEHIREMR